MKAQTGSSAPSEEAFTKENPDPIPGSVPAQGITSSYGEGSEVVARAANSYVLPGEAGQSQLPKLSRLQHMINRRVALEYGWQYPYCPKEDMLEIEGLHAGWIADEVWTYLEVPKSQWNPRSPSWGRFQEVLGIWSYSRHIHMDRVVIKRPNRREQELIVTSVDKDGKPIQLPDPGYYR